MWLHVIIRESCKKLTVWGQHLFSCRSSDPWSIDPWTRILLSSINFCWGRCSFPHWRGLIVGAPPKYTIYVHIFIWFICIYIYIYNLNNYHIHMHKNSNIQNEPRNLPMKIPSRKESSFRPSWAPICQSITNQSHKNPQWSTKYLYWTLPGMGVLHVCTFAFRRGEVIDPSSDYWRFKNSQAAVHLVKPQTGSQLPKSRRGEMSEI